MKKTFIVFSFLAISSVGLLSADDLKNSLTNIMHQKSSTGMVNLNGVNINGKPKPKKRMRRSGNTIIATVKGYRIRKKEADKFLKKVTKGKVNDYDLLPKKQRKIVIKELVRIHNLKNFKSRPAKAIVATVDGVNIRKSEADAYLKKATNGKVKDFDRLDKKRRLLLIEDLAKPIVINNLANNEISNEEKEKIFSQVWLQKKRESTEVTNDEMLLAYEEMKKVVLAKNPQAVIPPYISLGDKLKGQVLEQKIMSELNKNMEIVIIDDENVMIQEINTTAENNESNRSL